MKYMVTWHIAPENYKAVIKRFGEAKEPMDGIKDLGRWHETGTGGGVRLVETDDIVALTKLNLYWSDLLELKTTPVLNDEEASRALFG